MVDVEDLIIIIIVIVGCVLLGKFVIASSTYEQWTKSMEEDWDKLTSGNPDIIAEVVKKSKNYRVFMSALEKPPIADDLQLLEIIAQKKDRLVSNKALLQIVQIKFRKEMSIDKEIKELINNKKGYVGLSACELLETIPPRGFYFGNDPTEAVRKIGKRLNEIGGFKLMKNVHTSFSYTNKGKGLERSLEQMWDGIGSWRG